MRRSLTALLVLGMLALVAVDAGGPSTSAAPHRSLEAAGGAGDASAHLDDVPLLFIENQGQAPPEVSYHVQGSANSLYFTPGGVTLALTRSGWTVGVDFAGATPTRPRAVSRATTSVNYLVGPAENWRTNIPAATSVEYHDLWPGIDLVYSGTASRLKYTFYVHAGADPSQIGLSYRGATGLNVRADGQLEVRAGSTAYADAPPVAWQDVDGQRVPVAAAHQVEAGREPGTFTARLPVGDYEPTRDLVLDPAVAIYAGYLPGSGDDQGISIAVDGSASAYLTGDTASASALPVTAGAFDQSRNGDTDAYIAKVNPDGSGFTYVTYLGGGGDDAARAIAVDGDGNAYVGGSTRSLNFPVSAGAYDSVQTTQSRAFVFKLSSNGSNRVFGTYLKATSSAVRGLAVDGGGNAFATGEASAVTPAGNPFDPTANGGQDAFVVKLNQSGSSALYATHLGGSTTDAAFGIDVDAAGTTVYLTGATSSANFPRSANSALYGGGGDAFVTKLDLGLGAGGLVYSRFFGGSSNDTGRSIAMDTHGNAVAVGVSTSLTVPLIVPPARVGLSDGMLVKLSPTGALMSLKRIGGSGSDALNGVAVDGHDNLYVTGGTDSSSFGATGITFTGVAGTALSSTYRGGTSDAFVIKLDPALGLLYAGYFGGTANESGADIAVDWGGFAYVVGSTSSIGVSTNGSSLSTAPDAFFVKIGPACTPGLIGTPLNDVFAFLNKVDDVVCGLGGDDVILTVGTARVVVLGGDGDDIVVVGDGNDIVDGGAGNDRIFTGAGADMVFGGGGMDQIVTGTGNDAIDGGMGADTIDAGAGSDYVRGGGGPDTINTLAALADLDLVDGGLPAQLSAGSDVCPPADAADVIVFCSP
jgi:Ca2+-binding RTX toxin-like protein